MSALEVQVGSTIMNGSHALRVQRKGETGWLGLYVSLGTGPIFLTGTPAMVPFEELPGYRHVPFEWATCPGGTEEERYVWNRGCHRLNREVRPVV